MLNNVFKDDINDSIIIHIPHSSIFIPDYTGFNLEFLEKEIIKLTDWGTDIIFNNDNVTTIKPNFNRVFCDVERLDDDNEEMFKYGRGFFYTKTDDNKLLRKNIDNIKSKIYNNYYKPHHKLLTETVNNKLMNNGLCIIFDVHSFSNTPFKTDINQNPNRPDICLGIDEFHTPKYFIDYVKNAYEKYNLKVEINNPYKGTIIPLKYYNKNNNVNSIMIEINRDLYMENDKILTNKLIFLNKIFNEIINNLI